MRSFTTPEKYWDDAVVGDSCKSPTYTVTAERIDAYAELTGEGWLESRQGLGLYVAPPRQRLSNDEREKRMDEAVSRFVHDVIALDYPADEAVARIEHELGALAPRKSA